MNEHTSQRSEDDEAKGDPLRTSMEPCSRAQADTRRWGLVGGGAYAQRPQCFSDTRHGFESAFSQKGIGKLNAEGIL